MKAAFSNVLADLSLGRDIGPSLAALQETFFTFFTGNLIPMVGNIMGTLPEVLSSAFSMAIQGLNLAANNAEAIVQMATELVVGIGSAIITAEPYLAEAAVNLVSALGDVILSTDWGKTANDTIADLREKLDAAAGEILGSDGNIVQAMLDAIATRLPDILAKGGEMLNTLVNGILGALPGLTASALQLLTSFVNQLLTGLPQMLNTGKTILLNMIQGIQTAMPQMLASAGQMIGTLLKGIVQNLPQIISAGFDLVVSLIKGLGNAAPSLISGAAQLLQNVVTAAKNINWAQVGRDIVNGLINGIGAMGSALWSAARNIARSALSAIKGALGIRSPSKVMRDEVGKWIPAGVAVGIEANTKPLTDTMHRLSGLTTDTMQADLQLSNSALRMPVSNPAYRTAQATGSNGRSLEQILDLLIDLTEGSAARQNQGNVLLGQLLEAILCMDISTGALYERMEAHRRKMAVVRDG